MACILYKDGEKIFVEPVALDDMLAQGWATEPEFPKTPPTAAEYDGFLKRYEELKRKSDEKIQELVIENNKLTGDIEVLEGENITVRHHLAHALEQLKAIKIEEEQKTDDVPEIEQLPSQEPLCSDTQRCELDYTKLNIGQLREHAKRAEIPNYKLMRKLQLIKALKNGSETANKG